MSVAHTVGLSEDDIFGHRHSQRQRRERHHVEYYHAMLAPAVMA